VAAQPPEAAPARIAGMRSVLSALDPGRPATAADAARLAALLARAEEGRIHVVKRGSGPVPMVLVSDVLMPAEEVYGSFMPQNAGRYTMYAVTLPGFGASGTLPLPV